ncbi:pre-rRNA processing protein [Moelleriella libera RCEF 2490]|uniref:rRNA biogenesis protein RRP36 n=1 Tax=Moelleriella libera RCEF 2490 TaxID=1081109 RepID=A0A166NH31_9HYPO|nr:pre-rRNA processing protein [Moelleriella libera RCEF 2490]
MERITFDIVDQKIHPDPNKVTGGPGVRPRKKDDQWEEEPEAAGESAEETSEQIIASESDQGSQGSEDDDDDDDDDDSEDEEEGEEEEEREDGESDDDASQKIDLSSVSFGALARAQASLSITTARKRNRPDADEEPSTAHKPASFRKPTTTTSKTKKERPPPTKRPSKNAPAEQTSKRPVSRLREILAPPDARRKPRDPRFDPLVVGGKVDEARTRRAYAFLDDYRESEMAELRARIRAAAKRRDGPAAAQQEALKRQLLAMESRKKAQLKKDEEDSVLAEHRRREKELVAQGKTPFYLKRSEQKKQVLLNRFDKMSAKQVDKAVERRRKKVAGKEKKQLDQLVRRR